MKNYKTKVNSKDESKEVQELFESLGYEKGMCSLGNYPAVIVTTQDWATGNYCSTRALGLGIPDHDNYKEITLAELRDMVVLKRNDQKDRTHVDSNSYDWYVASDEKHYRHQGSIWVHQPYVDCLDLKPIEKQEMKEYLVPQGNGKYALTKATEKRVSDWVEVPDGKNVAYIHSHKKYVYFLAKPLSFTNHQCVWQRPTQPEALPFIDDEPKYTDDEVKYMDENGQGRLQLINDQYAEIEQVRQQAIEATLKERGSRYGDFKDVADTTQKLMATLMGNAGYSYVQVEALHMICSKLARIANGDPNYRDNWHDISGYAKLVEDSLD